MLRPASRFLVGLSFSVATALGANQPPVVSITKPESGISVIGPTTIDLEAAASSSDSSIASVTYYKGTTKLATETAGPTFLYAWKNAAAGTYSLTAVAKDALGVSSAASAPVAVTIIQDQPPVVTLSVPVNQATLFGPATIPLAATASSPDGEAISSVAFYNGSKKVGTSTAAPFTFSMKNVAAGTYTLSAIATDSLGVPSVPSVVSVTVAVDQPPLVSLTAAPAMGFGTIGPTSVLLTASVTQTDEIIASVAFYENGKKVATAKLPPYSFTLKNVAADTYTFTAVATDALGNPGNSAPVSFTVTPDVPPIVSITSPSNGFSVTGPATISLKATASSPDETISSVEFEFQGPTKIATVTKLSEQGYYTYTWNKVAVGSYTLTAVATDSLGVKKPSSPIGITVTQDQAPYVSIMTPISGATYAAPASIGLSASASSPDVLVSGVTYYQGTTKLATEKTPPYLYDWKPSTAGSYSLTAQVADSVGGTANSAPVTVNVTSTTTSSAKITKPSSGYLVAAPATVALTATAVAAAGVANVGFYAGGTLLGTSTSTTDTYQFSWQNAPAGLYYLTAVETDKAGASITSAPVSIRLDAPPVVQITTPASGSLFVAPTSISFAASATSSGTISKVEFFQNATFLGTATLTTAPFYQYTWTAAPLGTFSVTAEAFDSFGITAFSPPISIQVNPVPPVISLSTPTGGLTFGAASNVSLSFVSTASTSVTKVEIYRNDVLIATLTSPSSGNTWTFTEANPLPVGSYTYFARAYDSAGTSADSAPATVIVAPNLPFLTDFEVGDGFALGSLDSQVGWSVTQGTSNVSTTAYSGSQGIQLAAGSPAAVAHQTFASSPSESVIFCDFYTLPTAENSVAASTIFIAEGAEFGFQQSNGQGVLQVYGGNGSGGGSWVPTGFTIPLNSSNQAQNWVRLTVRLDFTKLTWDMYANGNMVAYDIPFLNNASTYFSSFQADGDVATDSFFDDIYIGAGNPLFIDANNDGIDDAWESLYGLSLSANDRYQNLSGDGIPIIQDFVNGTSPFINTKVTPPPVQSGLILDLRADAGVVADSSGNVTQWLDQSSQANIAIQSYTPESPQLAPGQVNGHPALSFSAPDVLILPYNMMQNAQAGEIIGVVEIGNSAGNYNTLWEFGTGQGTAYFNSSHFDDFGTSDTSFSSVETQAQVSQYYIYDTSIANGTSIYRYNGVPLWTRTGLPISFQSNPFLGAGLIGNIAELLVYNRVLTDAERFSIGQYLTGKYAFAPIVPPSAPSDLAAVAISSDTVDLSWTVQNPETMHTVTTISRATGTGSFVQVAQVNDASGFADTRLTPGTSYTYQITVQSYVGTSGPSNAASATTPSNIPDPPSPGLSLWLRSTVGTQGAGPVVFWYDQSGLGNNAEVANIAGTPQLVPNQVNGLPVVRFNGANALNLPQNMLQAAQAGQIVAVVKVPNIASQSDTLWNFGLENGTTYSGGNHYDDFGSNDTNFVPEDPNEIAQYYVYDTSIDSNGNATYRYDGTVEWSQTGLTVGFQQNPDIGGNQGGSLVGDIAEIILYDRVLSPQEQGTVYSYLAARYGIPGIVQNLNTPAITSPSQASGEVGQAFSYQITATNTPTGYGATGLPDGLSLNSATGLITGYPTGANTTTVTLTASNSSGTGSEPLTLSIIIAAPTVTSATSATGQVGQPFTYQIDAPGASSYEALGLPPGLIVDSVAGFISGTPTAAGSYVVALTAANTSGSGPATLTITVNPATALTSPATVSGQVSQFFSYQVATISPVTGYGASGLPPGLSIDPLLGVISGAPTTAGIYTVTLNLSDTTGTSTAALTITVTPAFPVLSGMLMWFRPDTGVVADSSGDVTQWNDQSGLGNNAVLANGATPPILVPNQDNGFPAIQFNGPNALSLPINVMQKANAGEIIAIVRIGSDPNDENTLWNFGSAGGTGYNNTVHSDDFGNSDIGSVTVETQAQISQYYVYDTSIDPNGTAIYRYNGTPLWTRTGLGGQFNSTPAIGGGGVGNFFGDIAEILVFDHALSQQEQGQVYGYLASKYLMTGIATAAASPAITSGYFVTGTDSQNFSFQVTANNGPRSFSASGLPTGLAMNSAGLITGYPTSDGPFTVTVTASNLAGSGSSPLFITINSVAPVVTSAASATGQVGQALSYQITASDNPQTYSATGLPSWLFVDQGSGQITGTPPTTGTFNFTVSAGNGAGSGSAPMTVTIGQSAASAPAITGSTTAAGQVSQLFSYQVLASGVPSSYSAAGLPSGMSIDSNGLISGTLPATPGIVPISITATNGAGSSTAALNLIVASSLIYSTGFELSDGFETGSLGGQGGWSVLQGEAEISAQDFNSGSQSLQLVPGTLSSIAAKTFSPGTGGSIEYCDFYAKPAAESPISSSSIFTVEGAQFGFQLVNGQGVLNAFYGNGSGGGTWTSTKFTIPLGAGNQSTAWVRLTARLDFGAQTWDLYANGTMLAASIPFPVTSSTYLSQFQIQGDAGVVTYVDDLYVGATNPLFADVNNDGINDAWETQYGLSLATNDRNGDPSGGGVTNLQKYIQGTSPLDFYNGIAPTVTPLVFGSTPGVGAPGPNDDLSILVLKPDGTPWINAPATFNVTSGIRQVSVVHGVGPYVSSLTVQTDSMGIARVYLQPQPSQ